jgi:cellulose synthase/poly-beta-1,6-N-acetylglucosamine synthase-like glycosyltransferase
MIFVSTAFWICIAVIVYHHLGYPLLLSAIARRRRYRSVNKPHPEGLHYPSITIIVPCHNESAVIRAKIENIAGLNYPPELLSVILVLDGCTDQTGIQARAAIERLPEKSRWRIIEYPHNRGKIAVLNEQIAQAESEIVALSDASALINTDALSRAALHFADPQIGAVCATYFLRSDANEGERAYWAYQRKLKNEEGLIAAPMGAHGAFYLFRRNLWAPLPPDTINDDFILPMRIVLQGYRAIYDEAIVATELEVAPPQQDFRRRVRIGAGNLQQFLKLAKLGDPRRGLLAFVFLSGKGLRALMPFILVLAFVLSIALFFNGGPIYTWLLWAEVVIVAIATVGWTMRSANKLPLFSHISYLLAGHIASGCGALLLLTDRHAGVWKFSSREKPVTPSESSPL